MKKIFAKIKWNKKTRSKLVYSLICVAVMAVVLFPIVWVMPGAFKERRELWQIPNTFLPRKFTWANFKKIFDMDLNDYSFVSSLFTTLAVSVLAVICSFAVNLTAGFAFARVEFRFKKFLWALCISTMFVPGMMITLTSVRMVNILMLADTFWVLILPGIVSGYAIFFFRQFFLSIPSSLEEAAMIDGCTVWQIYLKIFLPMASTPMVIIGIGTFMGHWNSYVWPTLVIINNVRYTQVMQLIRILSSTYSSDYGIIIASVMMTSLVPITLFALFQRKIVGGIAISGLK